ncbi:MAG: IS256 family transposase [Elusimicrobia bacterium]|nr:IS256 family transposase [Elusimicrobiota bacterium]
MHTVPELDLSDKVLWDRWQRVHEDFWGDLKTQTLRALQRLLETTMDIELQDLIGARRWAHAPSRRAHRNGGYQRTLLTSLGWMGQLRVPRLRTGRVRWHCLQAYQRRTPDVDQSVLAMFLAGVSTRRVQEVLEPLLGAGTLSSSTVSAVTKVLDGAVTVFHRRPLQDHYRYLILDGVYLKAKSPASVKRRGILVVYGIRQDGVRELIDYQLAASGESQAAWEVFLTQLKDRGLNGHTLELAVVDGNRGLWHALDLVWPGLARQRCWAHKLRNVANTLPRTLQKPCLHQARQIYSAQSYRPCPAALPDVETGLASPGAPRGRLSRTGLGLLARLLPCGASRVVGQAAHHQHHRTRVSGSPPTHPSHVLFPKYGERGTDHLCHLPSAECALDHQTPVAAGNGRTPWRFEARKRDRA